MEEPTPLVSGFSLHSRGDLMVGDVTIGDITGRDKIVTNIQHIYQHTLTAAEAAEHARELELTLLAEGIGAFITRLQARANERDASRRPYRGLLEYRLHDAELFFGRNNAIHELLQRLLSSPLTILHSESGAGKTSLLQAGIAPYLLAAAQLPVYLRPYDLSPALAIKRAFVADLRATPDLATAPLHQFLRLAATVLGSRVQLLIILDQFEEFFTQVAEADRVAFVGDLASCIDDVSLNVRWVLALRSEYFGSLATFRPRIRNPFANDYRLSRLDRREAHAVITEPARRRGLAFEDGLVETLLNDLGGNEVSPPQIQLVCAALYEALSPGEPTFTHAIYQREGGTAGILRGHLDRVLVRDLPIPQRSAARRLLEALITSNQRRVVRSHAELTAELSMWEVPPNTFEATLTALIDARLLKVQESAAGLVYELAHDYLLDELTLAPELQARKAIQELLDQEVRTYKQFNTLLTAERLAIIEPYREELRLTDDAARLLSESGSAAKRQQAEAEAQQERELRALRRLAQAQKSGAKQPLTSEFIALWLLRLAFVSLVLIFVSGVAYWLSGTSPTLLFITIFLISLGLLTAANLVAVLFTTLTSRRAPVARTPRPDAVFSPDGALLATVDLGCVRLWDASGALIAEQQLTSSRLVAFSPDSTRLLLTRSNAWPEMWSPKDDRTAPLGASVPLPDGAAAEQISGVFSPDGQALLTTTIGGYAHVWERSGNLRRALQGNSGGVFSPDGKYLLTMAGSTACLWTVQGDIVSVLRGHARAVYAVAFSGDSMWLATASADHTAQVWNLEGELLATLKGHTGTVTSVSFRPDGAYLITSSADRTARIWERGGAQRAVLDEHDKEVIRAEYSADGTQILTVSNDGTAKLWSVNGRFQYELTHGLSPDADRPFGLARYSPDGQRIVVIGGGRATVWDRAGHQVRTLPTLPPEIAIGWATG